jgi:hypothetical protein
LRYRRVGVDGEVRTRLCLRFRPPDLRGSFRPAVAVAGHRLAPPHDVAPTVSGAPAARSRGNRCGTTRWTQPADRGTRNRSSNRPGSIHVDELRQRTLWLETSLVTIPFSFFVGRRTPPPGGLPGIEANPPWVLPTFPAGRTPAQVDDHSLVGTLVVSAELRAAVAGVRRRVSALPTCRSPRTVRTVSPAPAEAAAAVSGSPRVSGGRGLDHASSGES